jgi:tetratricopeptide (TPR) repeat protein
LGTFYQTRVEEKTQDLEYPGLVAKGCDTLLRGFRSILQSYALLHLSFTTLLLIEALLTVFCLFFLEGAAFFAILFASFFLTLFSYILITHYFQGKKPEQFLLLKKEFFQECQKHLPYSFEIEETHFTIANSALQCTALISDAKTYILSIPPFTFLEGALVKVGFLLHWKDLVYMQEILLERSIQEHVELIKLSPTDLSVHTSLANTYIALAKAYQKPNDTMLANSPFIDNLYKKVKNKSQEATNKAIEELKILDDLAPNDPWIHAQLASCYHLLKMSEEELREYEILLLLRPKDKDILYRLGLLYFEMGKNAKGLNLYAQLKQLDASSANLLISHYF